MLMDPGGSTCDHGVDVRALQSWLVSKTWEGQYMSEVK
jgi:hypothetical protein